MARVIKANKSTLGTSKVIMDSPSQVSGARIIDRELYEAQQQSREILKQGEIDQKQRLADGKKAAQQAKDDAMLAAASQSFEEAAKEAIAIFKAKGELCEHMTDDIKRISDEIVLKVLGTRPSLDAAKLQSIIDENIRKLRLSRRLKLMFSPGALERLKISTSIPEFELSESDDVNPGTVRLVTEVGNAICDEKIVKDLTS